MKTTQIKAGRTYTGDASGIVQRAVIDVGPEWCPGEHPIPGGVGVRYMLVGDNSLPPRRVYLDTFAAWAKREVKT